MGAQAGEGRRGVGREGRESGRVRDPSVRDDEEPDGSLATRLSAVEQRVPPPQIADLWLFPPLPDVIASSDFMLFTQIVDADTRALFSARMVPANGTPTHQVIVEHGSAPADRVPKLVQELQRRLGADGAARHVPIEGEPDRWRTLLAETRGEPDPV